MDDGWLRWRTRRRLPASAVAVPAQRLYQELVNGSLSPAFRRLGFTGSSGRYSLRADGCWALLGLQRSAYSDAQEVQFTSNLLVTSTAAWASMRDAKPSLPERPAPSTVYGEGVAQARIGQLLPEPADTWWRVRDGVDLDAVAHEVVEVIATHGLPWMRAELARCGAAPR